MRRAQELDPLSLIINANLGQSLYFAGDYDQASEQFRKTLEMDPNFIFARVTLGQVLLRKGRYEEAILQFQTALKLSGNRPNWWLGHLAAAYAQAGRRVEALKILSVLQQVSKQQYVGKDAMAYAYLGLGDNKRALDSLEQAVKDRDVIFLKPNPAFDPLRSALRRHSAQHWATPIVEENAVSGDADHISICSLGYLWHFQVQFVSLCLAAGKSRPLHASAQEHADDNRSDSECMPHAERDPHLCQFPSSGRS